SRWHLVTGAFGGLGRLAVNWLREKGARRIALLAPRVDESWLRDVEGGQTRVCRCDVGDAGQLATVLDDLAANGGIAGAIHAAGVLADAPLLGLDDHQLATVFAVKAQAASQLLQTLGNHDARYLILYSSAAAALGAPGQSAHALACELFVDDLPEILAMSGFPDGMRKVLFDPENQFAAKPVPYERRASWVEIAADVVRDRG
ncbi:MAG: SDR family oxidoreductase, partial [Bradyrhizobium sp.]|nr:SDR family oxidoreductase [Bradyrhizobium sp.]